MRNLSSFVDNDYLLNSVYLEAENLYKAPI